MRFSLPESRKARFGLFGGVGVLVVILITAVWSWRTISADPILLDQGDLSELAASEEPLAPAGDVEDIQSEIDQLSAYGDLTDEELAALVDEARRQGRLVDDSYESTVDRGVSLPDEDFDTFLIIGSDESGALADVVIYLLEPTNGGAPYIVSLPRDLYIESPCTQQYARINVNLNGCGSEVSGPVLVAVAVELFTGIPVDHFVLVDFDGFEDIVDAMGGVELCFEQPTRDRKSHFEVPAGCIEASGELALAWVRSRHTQILVNGSWTTVTGVDDFSRQNNQQDVLWLLAEKVASFESVTSFGSLVASTGAAVRIDESWTFAELARDIWDHRSISQNDVIRIELEVDNYRTEQGAAVLVPTVSFTDLLAEVYP